METETPKVILDKAAILGAVDLPIERLDVPEWGGVVHLRTLFSSERDAFDNSTVKQKGKQVESNRGNLRARLAVLVVCDAEGKRLFSDEDAQALGRKSTAALDRIWDVAARMNRLGQDAAEEAEKN